MSVLTTPPPKQIPERAITFNFNQSENGRSLSISTNQRTGDHFQFQPIRERAITLRFNQSDNGRSLSISTNQRTSDHFQFQPIKEQAITFNFNQSDKGRSLSVSTSQNERSLSVSTNQNSRQMARRQGVINPYSAHQWAKRLDGHANSVWDSPAT